MLAVVTGLIGSYPLGGMSFHYGQYVLGLKKLGWDVLYLEDTGKWFYDPVGETFVEDSSYSLRYLNEVMGMFGGDDSWVLRDPNDVWHGPAVTAIPEVFRDVDLFLNVSGSCWLRPEYRTSRKLVYIDTDPGYTQFKVAEVAEGSTDGDLRYSVDRMAEHDFHATFGENIRRDDCMLPTDIFDWIPTRQPICLELWKTAVPNSTDRFSTVLSWNPYLRPVRFGGQTYWGKQKEFFKIIDLPRRVAATFELAVTGGAPEERLRKHGWQVRPAGDVSSDPDSYRDYILASPAEFSVAKDIYVRTLSGWVSERTACYLASGRPAVVQDTGFGRNIPTGIGIHGFQDLDDAVTSVQSVVDDYSNESTAARKLAEEYFDSSRVLGDLLTAVGI